MDFTRRKYQELLAALKERGYAFITYREYCAGERPERFVILRHDVDILPENALMIAKEETAAGARATYYFRAMPRSWCSHTIQSLYRHGHEVGYHYESLTTCRGNVDKAYVDFCHHLAAMRELVPVDTICMHGSPRSPFDSKDIWKRYDYRNLQIIGEPYLTTDFSDVLYLTDTGRQWDGYKVSVRDKIEAWQERWEKAGWSFHTTDDIIRGLREDRLPARLMITTHPQRWDEIGLAWASEWAMQKAKNIIKAQKVWRKTHKG
ncbi:MAG: hypothetical protein J5871_02400 [Bacteroidales bacterium]|nr:hypothetical protein [Bacteroidales bacterium]